MSHKRDSEKSKTGRLPGIRILFAAVPVLLLIAAVCAVIWYIRHDTPAKAARSVMKQISSLDESALRQVIPDADAAGGDSEAISSLKLFFEKFSGKVVSVSQDADTADVLVRVKTPDARALAADIRLLLLKDSDLQDNSDIEAASDTDHIYSLMQQCLSGRDYPLTETEGSVRLKKTQDDWIVSGAPELSSLLLGGLPETLSDPWLLTPDEVLAVFLEKLGSASVEEWTGIFHVNDLFSTYAANATQIDREFLSRARDSFSWTDIKADTSGSHSDVSLTVTGIDTGAILRSYKEKLESYGRTVDAVSADSYAVSRKSASLLLESITENESTSSFPVTVTMDNDGTGWTITDSSALTDALLGGMSSAVEEFGRQDSEDQ